MFQLFKKSKADTDKKNNVADVLDKHLGTYVKVSVAHKVMVTSLLVVGVLISVFSTMSSNSSSSAGHIALIQIKGTISEDNTTGSGLAFSRAFERAVKDKSAKVILITASSGGGSPAQSEMMYETIRDYVSGPIGERKLVVTSMMDMCASACLAGVIASDEIYVHKNTIVGSIGVRMDGYNLDRALEHFGIERQVMTSGINKDLLDPYRAKTKEEEAFIKSSIMMPLHNTFVEMVKSARKGKLALDNPLLFTGMVWVGEDGVKNGLADTVMTTAQLEKKLKSEYDVEIIKPYNKESFSLASLISAGFEHAISQALSRTSSEIMY